MADQITDALARLTVDECVRKNRRRHERRRRRRRERQGEGEVNAWCKIRELPTDSLPNIWRNITTKNFLAKKASFCKIFYPFFIKSANFCKVFFLFYFQNASFARN